jgi:6-phosphogluconate dehydrogenase
MKVGFIGLGRMGSQMVARLLDQSQQVVAYDVEPEAVQRVIRLGATPAKSREEMVAMLGDRPVVWLMIPARYVDEEMAELLRLLPKGSTIVDGGNSDYRETLRHYSRCLEKGIELVDVGTSGGILGLKNGFSMMVGGTDDAVHRVEPLIKSLAQTQGYKHFGPTGTGHYVKMVHNAIEYGMMESYAEGYRLLREGPIKGIDLAAVGEVWQRGSIIASTLNALSAQILRQHPDVNHTDGVVFETGETGWALEAAKGASVPMPATEAAVKVRKASENGEITFATRLMAAMRSAFGGHPLKRDNSK